MTLSPAIIGAFVGLTLAVADNVFIGLIAAKAQREGKPANVARLRMAGIGALIVLPLIGYIVGPQVIH